MACVPEFQCESLLGEGRFGKVYCARVRNGGDMRVALKIMRSDRQANAEIAILRQIPRHPNIIQLLSAHMHTPFGNLIALELANLGEFFDFLSYGGRFPESCARYFFHQILTACSYLHEHGIFHRDIKLENMLLTSELVVKICDFNTSVKARPEQQFLDNAGSARYQAPEIIFAPETGLPFQAGPCDIFAMGVVLYMLLTCKHVFDKPNMEDPGFQCIIARNYDFLWTRCGLLQVISREAQDLLARMLEPEPSRRITMDQVRQHPWIRQPFTERDLAEVREDMSRRLPLVNDGRTEALQEKIVQERAVAAAVAAAAAAARPPMQQN